MESLLRLADIEGRYYDHIKNHQKGLEDESQPI